MEVQRSAAALLARPGVAHADLGAWNMPWFSSPFFPQLLAESSLSADDRALVGAYARDGYLIVDPHVPGFQDVAERIIASLAPLYDTQRRIQDAWKDNDDVRMLATLPAIDRVLRVLYQRDPIPFQTLNFPVGTQQHTHSDTVHFHAVPHGFMCGVWIALEDIDADNGPLHVYPGSHLLPMWNFHDLGLPSGFASYHQYEECIQACVDALGLQKKILTMRKGQAVIWAANLLHGGDPIRDPSRSRHSQVTHFYFADCLYYTPMLSDPYLGKMHLRQITDIRTGGPVSNRYAGEIVQRPEQPAAAEFVPSPLVREPNVREAAKIIVKRVLRKLRGN